DQRGPGFPRIVNGIIDIGAFEVQDGGSGPGRSVLPGGKPRRLDVAALLSPSTASLSRASSSGPSLLKRPAKDTLAAQEVAVVDRLFISLNNGDAGLALVPMQHYGRAKTDSWLTDPFGMGDWLLV